MILDRTGRRTLRGLALAFGSAGGAILCAAYAMPQPAPNGTMCQRSAADMECPHLQQTCQTFALGEGADCWYCNPYVHPVSCQPIALALTCTLVAGKSCGTSHKGKCTAGVGGGWFECTNGVPATPGPGNPSTCVMPNGC